MIAQTSLAAASIEVALVALPNRSLSRRGIFWFVALQIAVMLAVAIYSAFHGNVFAPGFALLEAALVAYCLHLVWLRSAGGQVISVTAETVEVTRIGAAPESAIRFNRAWTRVKLEPARRRNGSMRLLLGAHGRRMEIGAFLADDERRALAEGLDKLLANGVSDTTRQRNI